MQIAPLAEGKVLQALADPSRRAIFESLLGGEAAVKDITARFEISQPAVSQHLAALREAGLVHGRREGRRVFFAGGHAGSAGFGRGRPADIGQPVQAGTAARAQHARKAGQGAVEVHGARRLSVEDGVDVFTTLRAQGTGVGEGAVDGFLGDATSEAVEVGVAGDGGACAAVPVGAAIGMAVGQRRHPGGARGNT